MSRNFEAAAREAFPAVTVNGRDDKAWAKRIMFREERKDSDLMSIQVTFAKQALGLLPMPNQK